MFWRICCRPKGQIERRELQGFPHSRTRRPRRQIRKLPVIRGGSRGGRWGRSPPSRRMRANRPLPAAFIVPSHGLATRVDLPNSWHHRDWQICYWVWQVFLMPHFRSHCTRSVTSSHLRSSFTSRVHVWDTFDGFGTAEYTSCHSCQSTECNSKVCKEEETAFGFRYLNPFAFPRSLCSYRIVADFYRATACNATHGIAVTILSVCLSICLSVHQMRVLWQN